MFHCKAMPAPAPTALHFPSLSEWLESHGLGNYVYGFQNAGLDDFEQILFLQLTDYPITHEILQEHVEMTKIGHRSKFFMKLDQELVKLPGGSAKATTQAGSRAVLDSEKNTQACKKCVVM
jgi:hypothetical protein